MKTINIKHRDKLLKAMIEGIPIAIKYGKLKVILEDLHKTLPERLSMAGVLTITDKQLLDTILDCAVPAPSIWDISPTYSKQEVKFLEEIEDLVLGENVVTIEIIPSTHSKDIIRKAQFIGESHGAKLNITIEGK